jgi:protein-tyrosine phosphatase
VIRTSETHPIEVNWIEPGAHTGSGRLGLTYAPGKCGRAPASGIEWRRDLSSDLERLREQHGTDVLVSLMESFEYDDLLIPSLFEEARARGIEVIHLPIVDGQVPRPEQAVALAELVARVRRALGAGDTVVIHCRGGQGRTGLVAAVLLTTYGHDPGTAIATVRRAQPKAVESAAQQAYVEAYAAARSVLPG